MTPNQFMALVALAAASTVASAGTLADGTYRLNNHRDGAASPPPYGLRLGDAKFGGVGGDWTFDFNNDGTEYGASGVASAMFMKLVGGSSIHIYGQAWGGRDNGVAGPTGTWIAGSAALFNIDFKYTVGVGIVSGDDDHEVFGPEQTNNFGSVTRDDNSAVVLTDWMSGMAGADKQTFRLGDENNDLGHRGFAGTSGWGWLGVKNDGDSAFHRNNVSAPDDFLFEVGDAVIPLPTSSAMAMAGLGALAVRRRRA